MRTAADVLESLGIAVCLFGDDDAALMWNRSFIRFFPEHEAHLHVGEPYRDNLRRFYECRLVAEELPFIERYIEEGLARHRTQNRPFSFEHHGRQLSVASLPIAGVGRIRIWTSEDSSPSAAAQQGAAASLLASDSETLGQWAEYLADGVMVTGDDGRISLVNHQFVVMYEIKNRAAALDARFEEIYRAAWKGCADSETQRFDEGLTALAENLRFAGAPFELALPNFRWSRIIARRSADGRLFFVHVDISELKRQQSRLELAESRARASEARLAEKSALLEATLERMDQGVMMVNADRVVTVCNKRALELLDLPAELMASKPSFETVLRYQWVHEEFEGAPDHIIEFIRAGGILDERHSYERQRPDGRVIEIFSVPIEGGGVLRTYTDISERKRAEERIRHMARHDGLTSLVNREVFLEHLAGATQASVKGSRFAVHFIDLDHFKPINDRLGHAIGDKVLAIAADRMRQVARAGDVVARMGGDEFAILQFSVEDTQDATVLAQRVLRSLERPIDVEGERLQIGASIGIAIFPEDGQEADILLRNADTAMYASKAGGRQSVKHFSLPVGSD